MAGIAGWLFGHRLVATNTLTIDRHRRLQELVKDVQETFDHS